MAIMAPAIQIVKRADGRSSVAIAAYRAAALLRDERTGENFDYSRKSGVLHTEIMAPGHAPGWVHDRQQLWANVELASRRQDAQVAREFMLPLPHELTPAQRRDLVRAFVRDVLVSQGMIADIAIHLPDRQSDQRNHHAHVTCTMRHITPQGFGLQAREWNDDFAGMKKLYALRKAGKEKEALAWEQELRKTRPIFDWREQWANYINRYLKAAGHATRVDHRSWIEQGIDREAEPHVGVEATGQERKGEETRLGNERREVQERNAQREQNDQEAQILSLALERKKREARADHLAATALDRTRQALGQLQAFDRGHAEINGHDRQISTALAEIRRLESRRAYVERLQRQARENFTAIYGRKAERSMARFERDVRRQGIQRATRRLAAEPGHYGSLPGWQLGRVYASPERRAARALLARTAEIHRQAFYMQAKIDKGEAGKIERLRAHITRLKEKQAQAFEAPPEGRLIIQRAIHETARHLRREDWQKLAPVQRFHVTQARQLMRHEDLRSWADGRARKLIAAAIGPAPAPDLNFLADPVDLKKISASYAKSELDKLWKEIRIRHEEDRRALAAAEKSATETMRARHVRLTQKGFVGLLVRSAGLQHAFDAVFGALHRRIADKAAAHRMAMDARHERDLKTLRTGYTDLRQRVIDRLAALRGERGKDESIRKTEELKKQIEQTAKDLTTSKKDKTLAQIKENARHITEKKSRGWRRSDRRGRGYGQDDDTGYGYRRAPRPKPRKPGDRGD